MEFKDWSARMHTTVSLPQCIMFPRNFPFSPAPPSHFRFLVVARINGFSFSFFFISPFSVGGKSHIRVKRKGLAFEISYEGGEGGRKNIIVQPTAGGGGRGENWFGHPTMEICEISSCVAVVPAPLIVRKERHFCASFFSRSHPLPFPFLALCVRTHEKPLLPTYSRGERGRNMALACMPSFPKFNIWSCVFKN